MCTNCTKKECKSSKVETKSIYPRLNALPDELLDIYSVFLILTKRCNLECKYCFVDQESADMTYEVALAAVKFIYENSIVANKRPSINFFGGEPLLMWDEIIKPLTTHIREVYGSKFSLSITTNGVLLNREKLDFMKKNSIDILFSMDGDRTTQDLNRPTKNGKSSFDILENIIPLLLSYYPKVTFRSTTDHDNAKEFFNNYKYAVEKGFRSIFNIVNVFAKWTEHEKQELKEAIDMLGDYYLEILRSGKKVSFNPFDDMLRKLNQIDNAEKFDTYRLSGDGLLGNGRCGLGAAGFASVGVDGKLYSCQEMVASKKHGQKFEIGDIFTGSDDLKRLEIARSFNVKNVMNENGIGKCIECRLDKICDGACVINNYFVTGSLFRMPDILCFYYNALLDKAEKIRAELEVFKKKA